MALVLSDFNATGLETETLALITAGADDALTPGTTWYASPPRGDIGTLEAGSDIGVGPDDEPITRIHIIGSNVIQFNDNGPFNWGTYLSGDGSDLTLYLQTEAGGVASVAINTGTGNAARLRVTFSGAFQVIAATIIEGTEFIIAFARPATVIDLMPTAPTIADINIDTGATLNQILPEGTGGDAPLSYSLSPIPAGFTFNTTTRLFTGSSATAIASTTLTYTVTDTDGDSDTTDFPFSVSVPDTDPVLPDIADQTYFVGQSVSLELPEATGGNAPYVYRLEANPLLVGLGFVPATRLLSGQPIMPAASIMTYFATDVDGDEVSTEFNITVNPAQSEPDQIENVVVTEGDTEVTLAWPVPFDGNSVILRYEYLIDNVMPWNEIALTDLADVDNPSWTFTNLSNGTEYEFQLRAVNDIGNANATAIIRATPMATIVAPGVPRNLSETAGDTEVVLDWDAPISNGGSNITDYEVSIDGGTFISTGSTTTAYTATSLTNGQDYTFSVRAVNIIGAGTATAAIDSTPEAPTPTATGNEAIMVAWLIDLIDTEYHFWSGDTDLDFMGTTYLGRNFLTLSGAESSVDAPNRRMTISFIVADNTLRSELLQDIGPVTVQIQWLHSSDRGMTWALVPRKFVGRLSRPQIVGGVYTIEIETFGGDIDRGRPVFWSDEDQRRRFPGDKGMEYMRQLAEGVEISWPP